MNKTIKSVNESERKIDWEDVNKKISIICRKFSNIDMRYRDDLEQELRIHAYYYSDDYYDLQRKAIDFWRTLTRNVYPEVPFIDLELVGGFCKDRELENLNYKSTLNLIKNSLSTESPSSNKDLDSIALKVLDIIVEDIDGSTVCKETYKDFGCHKYRNGKINVSYLDLRFGNISYKKLARAVSRLSNVIRDLKDTGRI